MKEGKFTLLDVARMGEAECKKHLAFTRWMDTPVCPYCKHDKCYETVERYKCGKCKRSFSVTINTPFHDSKIPLNKWYITIYLMSIHANGISSIQLSKHIGVTQKTAWFMQQRIRNSFNLNGFSCKMKGTIECDETYVDGKNKNRHWDKKIPFSQGRSTKDKTVVFGMVCRETKEVRLFVVPDSKRDTLQEIIKDNVEYGSKVMTDEWKAYIGLGKHYVHKVVNHGKGQYVKGTAHTNTIEGVWSQMKRAMSGTLHNVSKKHLHRYAKEFAFRYNFRHECVQDKMGCVLQSERKLTYKRLTR